MNSTTFSISQNNGNKQTQKTDPKIKRGRHENWASLGLTWKLRLVCYVGELLFRYLKDANKPLAEAKLRAATSSSCLENLVSVERN